MRTAFIETLCELAEEDERIWLLCGDLGYSVLEVFAARFPARFVNAGVAEQNMVGVAAGLALSGNVVFIYSIANFPVMRCLEQIRDDICYHSANVKIVAVGGGLSYGSAGYSHHAVEDLAVMRAMPNMVVVAPGDRVETRLATREIAGHVGPCYLRLGNAGASPVYTAEPRFQLGKAILVRHGNDAALLSTGGMLSTVVQAADMLKQHGVTTRVLSLPTVKPIDTAAIMSAASDCGLVCVVEEHGLVGGLADAVARCLAGVSSASVRYLTLDTDRLVQEAAAGSQGQLLAKHALTAQRIAWTLERALASSSRADACTSSVRHGG